MCKGVGPIGPEETARLLGASSFVKITDINANLARIAEALEMLVRREPNQPWMRDCDVKAIDAYLQRLDARDKKEDSNET